ncbi:MAG: ABC transporter ATP-binding protein [Desulfococcaceae bacterium]
MDEFALLWNHVRFSIRQGFWMKKKEIVHDLTLSVPRGTVMGLVGPNGAGKTTTIKLGAGLLRPESGQVLICGNQAQDAQSRKKLALLTETQYIYPHLKLREWLTMLAGFSGLGSQKISQRIDEVLTLFELRDRSEQMMHTLSKGQLQRAGLAQTFVHEPDILLLDEPMSGLDPYWRYRVQKIFQDCKAQGKTILFSSHILLDVERLSDRIALLENGNLRWEGNISDLPRKIKGYEAVCHTDDPGIIEKLSVQKAVHQPGGEWILSLSLSQKDALLETVRTQLLKLESLHPVQEEFEEVLFHFTANAREKKE